jgi:hypothetical protein
VTPRCAEVPHLHDGSVLRNVRLRNASPSHDKSPLRNEDEEVAAPLHHPERSENFPVFLRIAEKAIAQGFVGGCAGPRA